MKLKTDKLIRKTFGNFQDPLKAKESFVGRALFQFRTFMPEM
jgi:hypothetical protein